MSIRLLLFDDIPDHRNEVKQALALALGGDGTVVEFSPQNPNLTGTHEKRLLEDLKSPSNSPVDLIVADRDLSSYSTEYRGLSEATVRRVADLVGVPECGYARGERPDDPDYIKRGDQREACIRLLLDPDVSAFARRVVAVGKGFRFMRERLAEIGSQKLAPAKLLAKLLEKPEYSDKITLYASGDQSRLEAVHGLRGISDEQRLPRIACFLGYWLWDSVLRFPGVTLGVIPASSYLNIRQDAFENDVAIQNLFAEAVYNGPFAQAKVKMWWRGMLDDMVSTSGFPDGRSYASNKLGREIPQSQCCEDSSIPAGYYCMLKEKPVSLRNSKGGLPWFPRGADIARVSTSALEELGPWL